MKVFVVLVLFASVLLTFGENDGKYRPDSTTSVTEIPLRTTPAIIRAFPTSTKVPFSRYDPRYENPLWNQRRYWPNDHYDPRYESPRYDNRYNPSVAAVKPFVSRPVYDYRTIRLEETVDAKGYRYVYETVGGIKAEEVGTFQNIGLKTEGLRSQGFVQITDVDGITFRIDYQSESRDPYVPRGDGREAPRTPPTIIKLLAFLESHK